MSVSTDQQAILELILARGKGYEELADMLGAGEDDVRNRARSALAELGGADPDRNVGLSDYLLGQADPITRADVVRHLREDPRDGELARMLEAKLRELIPDAELPRLPGEARSARFLRRDPAASQAGGPGSGADPRLRGPSRLSGRQSRLLVALAAAAVLLVAVVLALAGTFGGGNGGEAATAVEAPDEEISTVALEPPAGGEATGEAVFGLTGADTIYLELDLARLPAPGDDQTYVVWLLLTGEQGWPLAPLAVGPHGSFSDRLSIPIGLAPLVARVRFLEVTLAANQRLERLLRRAPGQAEGADDLDDFLLGRVGRTVLRGAVPVEESGAGGGQGSASE